VKSLAAVAMTLSMIEPAAAAERELQISRAGSRAVTAGSVANFTGQVNVQMLFTPDGPDRTSVGSVSFAHGARTNWHTHPLGQTLVVTSGIGQVQRWGGPVETIRVGDVVRIPPNTRHWHGAGPDSAMTHLAIQEALDGRTVDWQEPVGDAQYGAIVAPTSTGPFAAQRLMGDIAPKLAQLTDDVLFGDVWSRPGLSRRDRSLVTVSALIAMNRPEQLRSHLRLALQNGVTETEVVEQITQLAFYAGWPNAVTAVGVVREVFAKTGEEAAR